MNPLGKRYQFSYKVVMRSWKGEGELHLPPQKNSQIYMLVMGTKPSGDSGSGLFALHDMNYYVLGVTSIGPIDCGSEHPDAYTDVYAYMDWIQSVVKDIPTI
ncbi:melanization protease 1 [Trichonephila clavipes]|nr:melanization protease 1 [Trichonephila clavipes]